MTGKAEQIILYLYAQDRDKVWEVKEHKGKRRLTQNSYYWALCGKVANVLHMSKYRVHNLTLRDYGQDVYIGGELVRTPIPDTEEAEEQTLESQTYHIRPTAQVKEGRDGKMYRTYIVMRGSSDYNTAEMGHLLDGMIAEAQAQGIETIPPHELERIREYERIQEQKKQCLRDNAESATDS